MTKDYKGLKTLHELAAKSTYNLEIFGDFVAKREKYKIHTGMDALHYYLVQKHHWLPSQVKALNRDDLRFLLAEEMSDWTVPQKAVW